MTLHIYIHICHRKIHQYEVSILKIYFPTTRAPTFVKEIFLKLKAHNKPNARILKCFNTPLFPSDRSVRKSLSRQIREITPL